MSSKWLQKVTDAKLSATSEYVYICIYMYMDLHARTNIAVKPADFRSSILGECGLNFLIQGPAGPPQTRRPDRTEPGPARERGRLPRLTRAEKKYEFYLLNHFLFSFFQLLCVFGVGLGEHIFLIMHNKNCIVPTQKTNIF